MSIFTEIGPILLAAALLALIVLDLRFMRIPDQLVAAFLALFIVKVLAQGPGEWLLWQMGLAAVVFGACFVAFGLNLLGGGDAKVLPVLALFVPLGQLAPAMLLFSVALILSIAAVLACRRIWSHPDRSWAVLRERDLPMGLPMGLTGLALLLT